MITNERGERQHAAAYHITQDLKERTLIWPANNGETREVLAFCHQVAENLIDNEIDSRDLNRLLESRGVGVAYPKLGNEWRAALQFARNRIPLHEYITELHWENPNRDDSAWSARHRCRLAGIMVDETCVRSMEEALSTKGSLRLLWSNQLQFYKRVNQIQNAYISDQKCPQARAAYEGYLSFKRQFRPATAGGVR